MRHSSPGAAPQCAIRNQILRLAEPALPTMVRALNLPAASRTGSASISKNAGNGVPGN